jgi:imidazolonepropionase-like amidohydrolase
MHDEFLIQGGVVFDSATGESAKKVLAIKSGNVVPIDTVKNPKVIDASGLTVMFGLWDCHAHPGGLMYDPTAQGYFEGPAEWAVRAGANLLEAATYGVTGVRAVADASRVDIAWAKALANGTYLGPRLLCAGAGIRTTGGHGTAFPRRAMDAIWEIPADGADEMRKVARSLVEQGVDWFKLMITGGLYSEHETVEDSQFTDDELIAIMEVARNRGIPVAAHCGGARIAERFSDLGGRSIEHGYALDEKTAATLAKNGTWLVPTISVTHDFEMMEKDGWPSHAKDRAKIAAKKHAESLLACVEAGVKIATGADLNPIGPRTHREITLLETAGLTRLQALHAATSSSRELNGLGPQTSPEPGTSADLIFVEGDPMTDYACIERPKAVMTFGRFVIPIGGNSTSNI